MVEIPAHIDRVVKIDHLVGEGPPMRVTSDTCLIVGTAWNMMDDFLRARNKLGDPAVGCINRTCQFIKGDWNFTLDRDNAKYWQSVAIERAPWHSCQPGGDKGPADYPWIDYWWPGVAGSGTSAWGAAKIALFMGFERVVLCGAPLEVGAYADGVIGRSFNEADAMRTITKFRETIQRDDWMHPHVRSMSGWTQKFLGVPG